MATVISVANQKGGAGKTTTAINLAAGLSAGQRRVLVIDTDPQASFCRWSRRRAKSALSPVEVRTIPSGMLQDELMELRMSGDYDVIVVDCPGNIRDITQTVVANSDAVLCPVRATAFDFEATAGIVQLVLKVQAQHTDTRFMLFVNAKHSARTMDRGARAQLEQQFGDYPNTTILHTEIPDYAVIAEFGGTGESIYEYAPKSPAAKLYRKLTKEVVECLLVSPALNSAN